MAEKGEYTYEYPRAALTADIVAFRIEKGVLKVLLIQRGGNPYRGMWALPGGFMDMNETIEECARRELYEETGIRDVYMDQFRMFSSVYRDPRGRVVSMAFVALLRPDENEVAAGDDAAAARWFDVDKLPQLAFDHSAVIRGAREHLAEMLRLHPVAFRLVGLRFTLDDVRRVYEIVYRRNYDRRNFSRKLLQTGMIEPTSLPLIDHNPDSPDADHHTDHRTRHYFYRPIQSSDDSDDEESDGSLKDMFNFLKA